MKTKIKKLQLFRIIVQIAFLVLYPGLFILSFNQLGNIYSSLIKGNFNFIQAFPTITAAVTFIILTLVLGRFFCGWMCGFGAMNDFIYLLSNKVFKVKFKVNEKVDSVLKYVKYLVLIFVIAAIWTTGTHALSSTNPWSAFADITQFPGVLADYTIGFALLVLIAFGAFFIERFFCRYLCPLGAVFSIVSKLRIFKINKPNDKCGKCRLCTNNCAMGIPLYKMNKVNSGECINCLKCIETCPRSNTHAEILGEEVNPALASAFAIVAMTGVYSVSNLATGTVNNSLAAGNLSNIIASSSSSASASQVKYKDGTYTGSATGFRNGTTKIKVTVSNGKISSIETVSTQDTPQFYQGAYNTVADEIISAQSTSVDTVSGATFSSRGIINAVKNALSSAVDTNSTSSTSSSDNTASTNTSANNTTNSTNTASNTAVASNTTTQANNNTSTSVTPAASGTPAVSEVPTASASQSTNANTNTTTSTNANSSTSTSTQKQYKDGTYTGTGTGFRNGTTKIQVAVKNGKIASIQTVSTQDTPQFYQGAYGTVADEIISAQSTSVDTVSGATFSSRGIITAVKNALNQAL